LASAAAASSATLALKAPSRAACTAAEAALSDRACASKDAEVEAGDWLKGVSLSV